MSSTQSQERPHCKDYRVLKQEHIVAVLFSLDVFCDPFFNADYFHCRINLVPKRISARARA